MQKIYENLCKYFVLFGIGGIIYDMMELSWRGHTHWTMFILGGICFICLGLINELLSWDTPLWKQMLIGSVVITVLEFITGCIVNLWLGWNVWDYSEVTGNILGQICLPFSILWFFISLIGIALDDYIRWCCFDEEKPRYKFF